MMPRYAEILNRAWPLRITLASAVRAREIGGKPLRELCAEGMPGTLLLLYAALAGERKSVTLSQAARLLSAAAKDRDTLDALLSALTLALRDSGFDRADISREGVERLTHAALRAGCPGAAELPDMGYTDAFALIWRFLKDRHETPAPMDDKDMQSLLRGMAKGGKK